MEKKSQIMKLFRKPFMEIFHFTEMVHYIKTGSVFTYCIHTVAADELWQFQALRLYTVRSCLNVKHISTSDLSLLKSF